MLRHTNKEGPQTKPNRPTKPRHRPSDIRTHQAATQTKAVARGGKVGPATPPKGHPGAFWREIMSYPLEIG